MSILRQWNKQPRSGRATDQWTFVSGAGSSVSGMLRNGGLRPEGRVLINGTSGPDVLVGTPSADTIRGFGGNDTLRGRGGADHLYGGYGADRLYPGDDSRKTKDVLRGGPGSDRINVRTPDVVYAGAGNDTVRVLETYGWSFPTINCGPGRDTVIADYKGFGMSNCERMVAP